MSTKNHISFRIKYTNK